MNLKSKVYTALVIATSIGIFATHAFITGQNYTDLEATGGNTLLTEERWNNLIKKVEPINSQDGATHVGNPDGQGAVRIWGKGDGDATFSALYLDDSARTDPWVIGYKKHFERDDGTMRSLEISKWNGNSNSVAMVIGTNMDTWFAGNTKFKGNIESDGTIGKSCNTTTLTFNGSDGATSCNVNINQTGEHAEIKKFSYPTNSGSKTGLFQCFKGTWKYIDGPCPDVTG